jgi:hypothetical protein
MVPYFIVFQCYIIELVCTEVEKGGGVGIYANNNINVFQEIKKINAISEIFAINEILSKVNKENKICYLMGDFNIDLLKSESCDFANKFTEQLLTYSFYQLTQQQIIFVLRKQFLI